MKMTTMKKASTALTLTALIAVGVPGKPAWAASQQPAEQGFAWKDGAEVYTKVCALCHDTKVGPVLLGRDLDPIYIQLFVRHGNRAMPAFRSSEIDDQSLQKLAEYISKTPAHQ